jgi:hypothetical protein
LKEEAAKKKPAKNASWKLTLPDGSETFDIEKSHTPYYIYAKDSITFGCKPIGTTKNTKYSRCEYRELRDGKLASWETAKSNKMTFTFKVVKKPTKRPRIVIGQIHDAKDDVIILLANFETGVYEVTHNTIHYGNLIDKIELDTFYQVEISTSKKGIECKSKDHTLLIPKEKSVKGCYFKVGNYLQSTDKNDEAVVIVKDIEIKY